MVNRKQRLVIHLNLKNKINMQEVLDKTKLYTEDELREAILEALAYFSDSGGNRDLVIANKVIMQLNNKKQ